MKKPLPQEYGISQEDIGVVEKQESRIVSWVFVVTFFILIALIALVGFLLIKDIVLTLLGGIIPAILCTMLLLLLIEPILKSLWPRYKSVKAYLEAQKNYNNWWILTQKSFWLSLTGKEFELALSGLYSRMGYDVRLTGSSSDRGADIILNKDGKKIVVQCKAHKKVVGPAVARDLYGTLIDFKADSAILASISGFSRGIIEYIRDKPIELISLNEIILMQKSLDSDFKETLGEGEFNEDR